MEPFRIMIFQKDELIKYVDTTTYIDSSVFNAPEDSIPPGIYTVVHCEVDMVGNQLAVVNVGVRRAEFETPLYYGHLVELFRKKPESITVAELTTADLSAVQCEKTIAQIRIVEPWLWDYAPEEVKRRLRPMISKEDEAYGLVSQGRELISRKQYQEGISHLQRAVEIHPRIRSARAELGKAAVELGQIEDATKWFEEELSFADAAEILTANLYLATIFDAKGDMARSRTHLAAVMATEEYKRNPISMHPDVVRKIRVATANPAGERLTAAATPERKKPTSRKRRWEFWK